MLGSCFLRIMRLDTPIRLFTRGPNYTIRMQSRRAFQYKLLPIGEQQREMCRFVCNKALALRKERYEHGEEDAGQRQVVQAVHRTAQRGRNALAGDALAHPLQQTLKALERAYAHCFAKRVGVPRTKKKGQSASFRYPNPKQINPDPKQFKLAQRNSRILLPKLGWLRYRHCRCVLGTVKNVTVNLSCYKWIVPIQTEREVEPPIANGGSLRLDLEASAVEIPRI
ncbi:transposase [Mycetohabitans rhizoxinica]